MNSSMDRSYPLFRRNLKLEELHRKYDERNHRLSVKRRISKKALVWLVAVFLFAVSTPSIINRLQVLQELRSQAGQASKATAIEVELGKASNGAVQYQDFLASNGYFIDLGPVSTGILDVINCPTLPTHTGRTDLNVNITTVGTYFYWSRISTSLETNNSYYLSVDNKCPVVVGGTKQPVDSWLWNNSQNTTGANRIIFDLSVGTHTFSLISRQTNIKIDKILLTTDSQCVPVLKGDNCLGNTVVK